MTELCCELMSVLLTWLSLSHCGAVYECVLLARVCVSGESGLGPKDRNTLTLGLML